MISGNSRHTAYLIRIYDHRLCLQLRYGHRLLLYGQKRYRVYCADKILGSTVFLLHIRSDLYAKILCGSLERTCRYSILYRNAVHQLSFIRKQLHHITVTTAVLEGCPNDRNLILFVLFFRNAVHGFFLLQTTGDVECILCIIHIQCQFFRPGRFQCNSGFIIIFFSKDLFQIAIYFLFLYFQFTVFQ